MITIINADARRIPFPDQSVQCVVTSPPYWGLRDYGTAKWEGGDPDCDHSPASTPQQRGLASSTLGGGKETTGHQCEGYKDICPRCGAVRIDAQIGLEPTPAAYVASIVAVMRECWRVLKDDGTLWLNLGDSYASNPASGGQQSSKMTGGEHKRTPQAVEYKRPEFLKPKDLCGIPWRVAFALQDDGWYLRQDIIWSKPNPMPESVTDRCTKAHEYVFLLSKSARYYYDAEAIKDPVTDSSIARAQYGFESAKRSRANGHNGNQEDHSDYMRADQLVPESGMRNRRSVWTVATSPYSGAHFATFPPALIEPMILAGSRRGDVVLDPFAGSGTTGQVAVKHGRRAVMLDLNTKYIDLQFERTSEVQMVMI